MRPEQIGIVIDLRELWFARRRISVEFDTISPSDYNNYIKAFIGTRLSKFFKHSRFIFPSFEDWGEANFVYELVMGDLELYAHIQEINIIDTLTAYRLLDTTLIDIFVGEDHIIVFIEK